MFIIISSGITFIVRIFYPLDYWGALFGFIQTEYANFPKYVLFVILGAFTYSYKFFNKIPRNVGFICFGIGTILLIFALLGACQVPFIAAKGGYNYESLIWSVFDCMMNICMYIGVIVVFREYLNKSTKMAGLLAEASFGVYLLHVPIVVFVQFLLINFPMNLVVKFIVESVLGIFLSFFVSVVFGKLSKCIFIKKRG